MFSASFTLQGFGATFPSDLAVRIRLSGPIPSTAATDTRAKAYDLRSRIFRVGAEIGSCRWQFHRDDQLAWFQLFFNVRSVAGQPVEMLMGTDRLLAAVQYHAGIQGRRENETAISPG